MRTSIRRAQDDGRWGRAVLHIGEARFAAVLVSHTLTDLRDGRRRGLLRYESERVALDLVQGTPRPGTPRRSCASSCAASGAAGRGP